MTDKRMCPISIGFFNKTINPLITSNYSRAGRPQKVSNYQVFCAILYVLRTGIPWRDLPKCYGYWHTVYLRFKKGSDRGVWWNVLLKLQQDKRITMKVVMAAADKLAEARQKKNASLADMFEQTRTEEGNQRLPLRFRFYARGDIVPCPCLAPVRVSLLPAGIRGYHVGGVSRTSCSPIADVAWELNFCKIRHLTTFSLLITSLHTSYNLLY